LSVWRYERQPEKGSNARRRKHRGQKQQQDRLFLFRYQKVGLQLQKQDFANCIWSLKKILKINELGS